MTSMVSAWVVQDLSDEVSDDAITVFDIEARSGKDFTLLGFKPDRTKIDALVCSVSGGPWQRVINFPWAIKFLNDGQIFRFDDGTFEAFWVQTDNSDNVLAFSAKYVGGVFEAPSAVIGGGQNHSDTEIVVTSDTAGGVLIDLGNKLIHRDAFGNSVVFLIPEVEEDTYVEEGDQFTRRDFYLSSRDIIVDNYGVAHLVRNYSMTETAGQVDGPFLTSAFGSGLAYLRVNVLAPQDVVLNWETVTYFEGGHLPEREPARDPRLSLDGDNLYMITEYWEWVVADPRTLKTDLWKRNISPLSLANPFVGEPMTLSLADDYLVYRDESSRLMTSYTGTVNAQTELPLSAFHPIEALPAGPGSLLTATLDGHLIGYVPRTSPTNDRIFMADEAGDCSDLDGDGFGYLMECVLGSDPADRTSVPNIETTIARNGQVTFSLLFPSTGTLESDSVFLQDAKGYYIEFESSQELVHWARHDDDWDSETFRITGRGTVLIAEGTADSLNYPFRRIRVGRTKNLSRDWN